MIDTTAGPNTEFLVMSAPNILRSDVGNLTGVPVVATVGCPAYKGGSVSASSDPGGLSILRFGRSLPLVELFETFMIVGLIMLIGAGALQYSYNKMVDVLGTQGMSASEAAKILDGAASTMTVWIILGVVIILIGIGLYYFHRAYGTSTSATS